MKSPTPSENALKIGFIADALSARLIGPGDLSVTRLAHPADSDGPKDLAVAFDPKLLPLLAGSGTKAAVISAGTEDMALAQGLTSLVVVDRGRYALAKLSSLFERPVFVAPGIHPTAIVEDGAEIGENVAIGAYTYICAGAIIGDNSTLHPQVYIGPDVRLGPNALVYPGVRIGARVTIGARSIIHFNTSLGADGFSFVTPELGSVESAKTTGSVGATNQRLVRIASLGAVTIGDDVEIGANTSIDRGTIVSTSIGRGTKIDNQVQIGHNVQVGEDCLICGRVGIAGSAEVGDRVVLGGATGVADHVKVGDDAIAMGMSGIAGNIAPRSLVMGTPAKPRDAVIQQMFMIGRLKPLMEKVEKLTARLDALEQKGED